MDELALKIILLLALIVGSIQNEARKPYSFDMSNQIKMETRLDGGPYKEIFNKSGSGSGDQLAELIEDIECQSKFTIMGQEYRVKVQLLEEGSRKDSLLSKIIFGLLGLHDTCYCVYHVDIYNPKGEKVVTNIVKKEFDGGDWGRTINKDNQHESHSGICIQTFTDPLTGIDCMVESKYEASGRFYEIKDKEKEKNYSYVSLNSTAVVKVGFRKYLHGQGSVNSNIAYNVAVVDWNFDGVINEEDMVYFDYMAHQFLPLNQPTRLAPRSALAQLFRNKASKYEYVLRLTPPTEAAGYLLDIERVK